MSLNERLRQASAGPGAAAAELASSELNAEGYQKMKAQLHTRLIDRLDLAHVQRLSPEQLRAELGVLVGALVAEENLPLNRREREQLLQELQDEILGLGPLESLLRDPTISDILVNNHDVIFIERSGLLERVALRFRDVNHLLQTINKIVSRVGRRVDESSPVVDARLPDGSRVNAIIPPLAVDGPVLSIRRFGSQPLRIEDLLRVGAMSPEMGTFLEAAVKARLNILISGGTGTGKTTMLNALSSYIPARERIVTIEDAAELQLQQTHVVRLETRPSNVEGRGEVTTRDLVRNSLRMRPDRIIVGEIRSVEVIDMLQAMNTGHEGSMATIHANTPRDALTRMAAMIGMSGLTLPESVTGQMVARALDLIVQLHRSSSGRRRVISISEVTGMEGQVIQMQEIFGFNQHGVDEEGRELGQHIPTGIRPRCADRLQRSGYELDPKLFSNGGQR